MELNEVTSMNEFDVCSNCNVKLTQEKFLLSEVMPFSINLKGETMAEFNEEEDFQLQMNHEHNESQINQRQLTKSNDSSSINQHVTIFEALMNLPSSLNWISRRETLKQAIKINRALCVECTWILSQINHFTTLFKKLAEDTSPSSFLQVSLFSSVSKQNMVSYPKKSTKHRYQENFNDDKEKQEAFIASINVDASSNSVGNAGELILIPNASIKLKDVYKYRNILSCQVILEKLSEDYINLEMQKIKVESLDDVTDDCYINSGSTFDLFGERSDSYEFEDQNEELENLYTKKSKNKINLFKRRKNQPLKCNKCPRSFSSRIVLTSHIRNKHPVVHACQYCRETFGDRKHLRIHLKSNHDEEKTEICKDCSKSFFTKQELKVHQKTHKKEIPQNCAVCNCSFPNSILFKAHQMTHVTALPFPCPVEGCGKRYGTMQLYQSHLRYMHERRDLFKCTYPGCSSTFGTETYLKSHVISHETVGSLLCELCGKSYKHKKDLRIHEQRFHSEKKGYKPFACGKCPARYYRADHLRVHQVKHNHVPEGKLLVEPIKSLPEPVDSVKDYRCDICNKSFVSDLGVQTHRLTHTEKFKKNYEFSCPECERKYINSKALDYHIRYMHRLKGSHTCSVCSKSFGRYSALKRHQLVHVTPQHKCSICEKSYKVKSDLEIHYRSHVQGKQLEFSCSVCNKRFHRKDLQRIHQVKAGHLPENVISSSLQETFTMNTDTGLNEASELGQDNIQDIEREIEEISEHKDEVDEFEGSLTLVGDLNDEDSKQEYQVVLSQENVAQDLEIKQSCNTETETIETEVLENPDETIYIIHPV